MGKTPVNGKLNSKQRVALRRLMNMYYTRREIAERVGIGRRRIEAEQAAGLPFVVNGRGHVWVNGAAFCRWLETGEAEGYPVGPVADPRCVPGAINRRNHERVEAWLAYQHEVRQVKANSITTYRRQLSMFLEWALDVPWERVPEVRPGYPTWLIERRRADGTRLADETIRRTVGTARDFMQWLVAHHGRSHRAITVAYLDTLYVRLRAGRPRKQDYVTLDHALLLARSAVRSMRERRARAAACFLYLSAARVTAFTTLPIRAIDLARLEVRQWTDLGVDTKNSKSATTILLDVPELLAVVRDWDALVRRDLPPDAYWFAPLKEDGSLNFQYEGDAVAHRDGQLRSDLKLWCSANNLRYYAPHKFRSGHAVYGYRRARTMAERKAISMNLMHSSMATTDSVYAALERSDRADLIAGLADGGEGDMRGLIRDELRRILGEE